MPSAIRPIVGFVRLLNRTLHLAHCFVERHRFQTLWLTSQNRPIAVAAVLDERATAICYMAFCRGSGRVALRTCRVIGAVGVSSDLADKDEACALAGIEAADLVAKL